MVEYALFSILSIYILWLFYLAVMNLKRAKDNGTISKTALYLGYPILFIGLLIDLVINVLVMTILFISLPQELSVTTRLSRHLQEGGWRGNLAFWFCSNLLDTFDPSGKHCK